MIRKCSLMFSLIALTTFLSVQNPHAKPVGNRFTTSVTLGPAVFPMPGIRFQYRFNDHLSLNSGLSYIVVAGDFNAGIKFLPACELYWPFSWHKENIHLSLDRLNWFKRRCCRNWNRKLLCGSRSWIWSGKNRFWQYKNRVGSLTDRMVVWKIV